MANFDRRSFLKLLSAAAPGLLAAGSGAWRALGPSGQGQTPNIIILVLDALSATNLSLYGYPRPTTPRLEEFAARATVYHSHYSGGNYTIPGVSTLLSGTYPWTSRAINHSGGVRPSLAGNNIFRVLGPEYHRLAYPQSIWANFILTQFANDIDVLMPSEAFGKLDYLFTDLFPNDANMALRALDDFVFKMSTVPTSMVFGPIQQGLYYRDSARLSQDGYPRGLPHNVNYPNYFRLEDLFGGLAQMLPDLPAPFFAYLHLFPPHAPYRPSRKFNSKFIDGWWPMRKPVHPLSDNSSYSKLMSARRSYDEYVASIDAELGQMLESLRDSGLLDASYLIITSDHGEMFERGEKAHSTPLLYDPVVHIPLVVCAPGQRQRHDVHAPTNAVDLLPTVAHLAGKAVPAWSEGTLLPGLGGQEDLERSTFSVEAKLSPAHRPLKVATIAMRKGPLKLTYYAGYRGGDTFELHDLDADPEEMTDLYPAAPAIAGRLREELLEAMLAADRPYQG